MIKWINDKIRNWKRERRLKKLAKQDPFIYD